MHILSRICTVPLFKSFFHFIMCNNDLQIDRLTCDEYLTQIIEVKHNKTHYYWLVFTVHYSSAYKTLKPFYFIVKLQSITFIHFVWLMQKKYENFSFKKKLFDKRDVICKVLFTFCRRFIILFPWKVGNFYYFPLDFLSETHSNP